MDQTTRNPISRCRDGGRLVSPWLMGLGLLLVAASGGSVDQTARNQIAALTTRVTALETRATADEGQLAAVKTALAGLTTRVTGTEGRLSSTEGRLTAAEGRLATAEGSLTTLAARLTALETPVPPPPPPPPTGAGLTLTNTGTGNDQVVTIDAPGQFRLVWEAGDNWGLSQWYDLVNDPTASKNLVGPAYGVTHEISVAEPALFQQVFYGTVPDDPKLYIRSAKYFWPNAPKSFTVLEQTAARMVVKATSSPIAGSIGVLGNIITDVTYAIYPSGKVYVHAVTRATNAQTISGWMNAIMGLEDPTQIGSVPPDTKGWIRATASQNPYTYAGTSEPYVYAYWSPATPAPYAGWAKASVLLVPRAGNPSQGIQAIHSWTGHTRWGYVVQGVSLGAGQSIVQDYLIQLGTEGSAVLPNIRSSAVAWPIANAYQASSIPSMPGPVVPPPTTVPIPGLAKWQSQMLTFGQKRLDYLAATASHTWDDALSNEYYDGPRVLQQIATFTGGAKWLTGAQQSIGIYRDTYVLPNNGGVPGYWSFSTGLRMDFARTGAALSKQAAILLSTQAAYTRDTDNPCNDPALSREAAYAMLAMQNAEALGEPHRARRDVLRNSVYGHFPLWMTGTTGGQVSPFMIGLSAHSIIRDWEQTHDARALPTLKAMADWLWANAWDPVSRSMWYDLNAVPRTPAADLNLLIAPMYAWLWQQTGNPIYRDRGDQLFVGGVEGAWLDGGKQFNQNYWWSFDYVQWRS